MNKMNLLNADASVITQIERFAGILADWATKFAEYFIGFLGSHMLFVIPFVLMFVVLGINVIRKLIHGY